MRNLALLLVCSAAVAQAPPQPPPTPVRVSRLPITSLTDTITDDVGRDANGRATVMVRLRVVLPGLVYRAGRNDTYMPYPKTRMGPPQLALGTRMVPPQLALDSLCASDFRHVFFLYADPLPPTPVRCGDGRETMTYEQARVVQDVRSGGDKRPAREKVIAAIFSLIVSGRREPVLVQDRAGLHAAGYISAIVLQQFCGMNGQSAVNYWTDKANVQGVDARGLINDLKAFTPLARYRINPQQAQAVCPSSRELAQFDSR